MIPVYGFFTKQKFAFILNIN